MAVKEIKLPWEGSVGLRIAEELEDRSQVFIPQENQPVWQIDSYQDFPFNTSFITEKKLLTLFSSLNFVQKSSFCKFEGEKL